MPLRAAALGRALEVEAVLVVGVGRGVPDQVDDLDHVGVRRPAHLVDRLVQRAPHVFGRVAAAVGAEALQALVDAIEVVVEVVHGG